MSWRYLAVLAPSIACSPAPDQADLASHPTGTGGLDPAVEFSSTATSSGRVFARPSPGRGRGGAALESNAQCEACHPAQAEQWRTSRHHRAATNSAYRAAARVEDPAFCRSCHAPESDVRDPHPQPSDELGVGCVTCHVTTEGAVLAAGQRDGEQQASKSVPHRIQRSVDFSGVGACASCHEFNFPGVILSNATPDPARLMQSTLTEHAQSPASERPCAACHMPRTRGSRDHGFAQVRDVAWLQRKLDVSAELSSHGSLAIRLRQKNPAHAFPTGDLFRRLEVGAELTNAKGAIERREVRHLGRRFRLGGLGLPREQVSDDRLFDAELKVELDVTCDDRGSELRWWVSLQRVAFQDLRRESNDEIESETLIALGTLCEERGDQK